LCIFRTLNTQHHQHHGKIIPEAAIKSAVSKDNVRDFMAVWPDIVRDINEYAKQFEPHFAPKYLTKLLQYNVPNGKKNRGLVLVHAYKVLAKEGELTEENIRLAQILGWCVEMVGNDQLMKTL
jgi:farnesyl diphosphate synthase